jgi:hypothetical protein
MYERAVKLGLISRQHEQRVEADIPSRCASVGRRLGAWLDVDTGLNSENDIGKGQFAMTGGEDTD